MPISVTANITLVNLTLATGIASSALWLYLQQNYGSLSSSGKVVCEGSATQCTLSALYGDWTYAMTLVALLMMFLLLAVCLSRIYDGQRSLIGTPRRMIQFMALTAAFAIATAGWDIYVVTNFGAIRNAGKWGTGCTATACPKLQGTDGNVLMGLNITNIVLCGLGILGYSNLMNAAVV